MKQYKKFYIEITNRCNLDCSFCPKTGRKLEYMPVERFEKIIDEVKGFGYNFYLHVMGEPTSHPHLEQILKICKENNIRTNITTNGTLLDKVGDIIIENNVRMVSVSLHSFEANTLNKSMIAYLDSVMNFCYKCFESDTICELRLWNIDRQSVYDKNQLNGQIIAYLQDKLALDFDLRQAMDSTLVETENGNQRKFNLRLKGRVFMGMAEHFEWPDINKPQCYNEGFCYGLRNQVAVLVNGDVVPCCLDSEGNIPLGNIFVQPFEEIINGTRARNIYDGFSNRKAVEPLCKTCGYMNQHLKK